MRKIRRWGVWLLLIIPLALNVKPCDSGTFLWFPQVFHDGLHLLGRESLAGLVVPHRQEFIP